MRVDIKRTNPDVRQIQLVNNSFAWNESVPGAGFIPGTTATPTPGTVKDRLLELWSTPHGALKAAELVQMQRSGMRTALLSSRSRWLVR